MSKLLLLLKENIKIFKKKDIFFSFLFLTTLLFFILFKSFLKIPDPYNSSGNQPLQTISSKHWLGTDAVGYDLFSRVLEGAKISLKISFITIIISSSLGTLLGLIAGYYNNYINNIIMFICDILTIFPSIILAILIMLVFNNQSVYTLITVLSISFIPSYIRVIRAHTLTIKQKDFIKASKALGANDIQVIKRHILPNILTILITKIILNISDVILAISGFGFIGLGLDRTKAEWGNILYSSKSYMMYHPYLLYGPLIVIVGTILSFNLIGNRLIKYFEHNQNI
ncbi:MAG: ABC transporter permease [Vigna little leaf phytoplasma]|nr:ABC transporter permease [Vigna little leaf phytoplasma]